MHCSIAEESNYCPPTSKENNFGEAESTKAGLRNVQHIIEIWKEKKNLTDHDHNHLKTWWNQIRPQSS